MQWGRPGPGVAYWRSCTILSSKSFKHTLLLIVPLISKSTRVRSGAGLVQGGAYWYSSAILSSKILYKVCFLINCPSNKEEHEGTQWGRPGPGGAYWRNSAVTGQGFFDKMVSKIDQQNQIQLLLNGRAVSSLCDRFHFVVVLSLS